MRTRSRIHRSYVWVPERYRYTAADHKRTLIANGYISQIVSDGSSMDDVDHGDRSHSNPCLHRKYWINGGVQMLWLQTGFTPGQETYTQYPVIASATSGPDPSVSVTMQQADCVREMLLGNLTDQVLTPVFVKELPEISSTWRELNGRGFGAKKFANKFLAYKFGVLPFLSDLKKLADGYETIRKHIKFVNENYAKTVKVSRSAGTVTGSVAYTVPTGSSSVRTEYVQHGGTCRTMAKLLIVRQYKSQDVINSCLDYYGAAFANCIWEALPYSFVVDWFVDVGGLVNHLQPKNQIPCARVLDVCTVVKSSHSIPLSGWDDLEHKSVLYGTVVRKYFSRTASTLSFSSILGSGLDLSKALVGGALVIQRV